VQALDRNVAYVVPIDQNLPLAYFVEPGHQIGDRGLACSGWTNQGNRTRPLTFPRSSLEPNLRSVPPGPFGRRDDAQPYSTTVHYRAGRGKQVEPITPG
jgi:hypothetical protein